MCTQRQVEGTYTKDELNGRGSGGQSLQCPGQGKQDTHAAHGRQQREHDGGVAYWHTLAVAREVRQNDCTRPGEMSRNTHT